MKKKPIILYVDDEEHNLISFKANFRDEFQVLTANSAQAGLDLLAAQPAASVAVVVSDQRMPEMPGSMMFTKIPPQHQDAVRILLTAYMDLNAAQEALNMGKIRYFYTKPYQDTELRAELHQAVAFFSDIQNSKTQVDRLKKEAQRSIKNVVDDHESKRRMISNQLHEDLAQKLAALKLSMNMLTPLVMNSSSAFQPLTEINSILEHSIGDIRKICFEIMPPSLSMLGLEATIVELTKNLNRDGAGLQIELARYIWDDVPSEAKFFLYRVIETMLSDLVSCTKKGKMVLELWMGDDINIELQTGDLEIFTSWIIPEVLTTKIQAYNGRIKKGKDKLHITFSPASFT